MRRKRWCAEPVPPEGPKCFGVLGGCNFDIYPRWDQIGKGRIHQKIFWGDLENVNLYQHVCEALLRQKYFQKTKVPYVPLAESIPIRMYVGN